MSKKPAPPTSLPTAAELPPAIAQSLLQVVRRRRYLHILNTLLRTLLAALAIILAAVLILGPWSVAPAPVRWLVALAAVTGITVIFIRDLRPVFEPIFLRHAAGLVEQKHPEHQERLLSAVEFTESPATEFTGSPQMIGHVIQEAQTDVQQLDPRGVLSAAAVWRWGWFCLPVLLVWLLLWGLWPRTIAVGLARTLQPWNGAVSQMALDWRIAPGNATIASGEALTIRARDLAPSTAGATNLILQTRQTGGDVQTLTMTPTGPNAFLWRFSDVDSSFQYRVACHRGRSAWYTVTVVARPAISSLTLHYHYPDYTHLPPRTDHGLNGWIRAIAGTQVQVDVQATQPLGAPSHLHIDAPTGGQPTDLPLTHLAGMVYQATLNVWQNTDYHICLMNAQGAANRADQGRPIIALPDLPPVVRILDPQKIIQVRPDDTVPVRFEASDDFGLTSITALVSVDHSAPMSYPVATLPETAHYLGQWKLAVADQLLAVNRPQTRHIYYRLQATDNHQPQPQHSVTALYELVLNPGLFLSYQQRQDLKDYQELQRRIQKALAQVQAARRTAQTLQHAAPSRALEPWQKHAANRLQNQIAQTAADLTATPANQSGAYADLAQAAVRIANGPLHQAAENLASATLNDQPRQSQMRTPELAAAGAHLAQSAQQLQALSNQLRTRADQRQILDNVRKLAARQQRISQDMNLNPQSAAARAKQAQMQRQLQTLIQQHQVLQTPAAAQVLSQFNQLKNDVGRIVAAQTDLQHTLQQQARNQAAGRQLDQLARRQQQLNQDIANFAAQQQPTLQSAETPAPTKSLLTAAVRNLQTRDLEAAQENQQEIAQTLDHAAAQLTRSAHAAYTELRRPRPATANNQRLEAQLRQQAGQAPRAAGEARQLLQRQNELTRETAQAMAHYDPHLPDNAQLAKQAGALPGRIAAAESQAGQIAKQAQSGAPDVASNVTAANRQMNQARHNQQAAARAEAAGQHAAAQEHQQAALEHMATAQADLNGLQHSPEMQNVPRYRQAIAGEINPSTVPADGQHGSASSPASASSKPGQPAAGTAPGSGQAGHGGDQLMAAAQQLQNALSAEGQATGGNSAAAQQAAASLRSAFGAIMQMAGYRGGFGQAGPAGAGTSPIPGGIPGGITNNPGGIMPGQTTADATPQAVKELGISPQEWRNLGPLARKHLLNTARQSIPPGYRQMVRDYYLRLAQMSEQ